MSGSVIPELARLPFAYEATGNYLGAGVTDGKDSTPDDDGAIGVAAKYLTMNKTAITGNWLDDVQEPQSDVALAEQSNASVHTRMPAFGKQV